MLVPLAARSTAPQRGDALKQHLVRFFENGGQSADLSPGRPLHALRAYPVTATTAFLLLENDPLPLRRFYPDISRTVMQLFEDPNLAGGLVRSMPGAPRKNGSILSPGLNALAALELYSLHLIAWKTGAYEDALEFLAWSRSLSDLVTRGFYDPERVCFYPVDADGRFVTAYRPGQLLPLVVDRNLGRFAHERIAAAYLKSSERGSPETLRNAVETGDPWADPSMRFMMLDLLSAAVPDDGALFATLRASAAAGMGAAGTGQALWTDYWRENRTVANRLFPRWRAISPLVNLTLLFERDGLVQPKELVGLRSGIDSLAATLSGEAMSLESYKDAISVVNRMLSRFSRFSQLLDSPKESWRVIDGTKWRRLSPRVKRLIMETLAGAPADLAAAKAELSSRLERECGIAFTLGLPEKPITRGSAVEFSASLRALRDTLPASRFYLQIGDQRWKMMETTRTVTLVPNGEPFIYKGKMALPPTTEPGVVTLNASIDFVHTGRMVEIRSIESVAVTKEFDAVLDLPDGRRIGRKPLRLALALRCKTDRDLQGTIDGTILREFSTTPPLPARFLVRADAERTDLAIAITPKGTISPGRYPFSLTVTLDGNPVALFKECLVRPFNWLHLGTLAKADEPLRNAISFQSDLFKSYPITDGRELRWSEVPPGAIDNEGSLQPQRLYGKLPGGCALFYTVVDAPARLRVAWRLVTKNASSLWINGEPFVPGTDARLEGASGPVELRKGPNSILIAVCWDDAPDGISFDLGDDNGLPPSGLVNELDDIIDGYERLSVVQNSRKKEAPAPEQLEDAVVKYTNPRASEVSIIGSFNNWDAGATPMKKEGKGAWTVTLHLRAGKYPYKFLVNRKQKIADPANAAAEPDGFGGSNSILEVK
ncbi:MAG: isoamylase early set domain-containing protein [Candidatus Krumholzibacteriia bacterium]